MRTPDPTFAGVEMKQANRNRKHLPGGGELAALIRGGATIPDLQAAYDVTKSGISKRLHDSGYSTDGSTLTYTPTRHTPVFVQAPQEWTEHAICAHPDIFNPDWWHADGPAARYETKMAKKVCTGCPVRMDCLKYGLEVDEQVSGRHGVYGGLTGEERARLVGRNAAR